MAYLGYLVRAGVVKEAYCNFLPVGHTHEDIDQIFSRISVFARRHDAASDVDLRWCIRRSCKKYGKAIRVYAWHTIGNLSAYLDPFISSTFSNDITLYYQFKISIAHGGKDAGEPIMEARTWPGAAPDDPKDFWRGLLPNTTHVRVFKEGAQPDLVKDYDRIPPQAQPAHVAKPNGELKPAYLILLNKQKDNIEHMMGYFPTVFPESKKEEVRKLLLSLRSNLDPQHPVKFDWDKDDMHLLYTGGQYYGGRNKYGRGDDGNIFGDQGLSIDDALNRPDSMEDPQGFVDAVQNGDVNLLDKENCHACILEPGLFYLQRPDDVGVLRGKIKLVRVMKVIADAQNEHLQWGAWVQEWEVSTLGDPNSCCITDPYHARGDQPDGQRYDEALGIKQKWAYTRSVLSEFQDNVHVNKAWQKPKGWNKTLSCIDRVKKRNIFKNHHKKVRTFLTRWRRNDNAF